MRKLSVALIALLFIMICFPAQATGIKIWPGSHFITINKWYSPGDYVDRAIIQVTNTESYNISVTIGLDNPTKKALKTGYSYIPKLSWIKIYPKEELFIPAGSSREIEVSIEVPDKEQSSLYNERWEAWVIVTSPPKQGSGINIQTEVGIKIFIKTPVGKPAIINNIHISIIIIFILTFLVLILYYMERKKKSATLYYYKKKK